jgi:hypothetical protein
MDIREDIKVCLGRILTAAYWPVWVCLAILTRPEEEARVEEENPGKKRSGSGQGKGWVGSREKWQGKRRTGSTLSDRLAKLPLANMLNETTSYRRQPSPCMWSARRSRKMRRDERKGR